MPGGVCIIGSALMRTQVITLTGGDKIQLAGISPGCILPDDGRKIRRHYGIDINDRSLL